MSVYGRLLSYQDEKYKDFQSKLVPNIDKKTIIGVKTPQVRKIVKEVYGTKESTIFLQTLPHQYYEENLIHFFLISKIKDFDECIKEVERFLNIILNLYLSFWNSLSLKIALLLFILLYIVYHLRIL